MRRFPLLMALGAVGSLLPLAGASAGQSAIHPENRPSAVEGETNGQMSASALITVEGSCRLARAAAPSLSLLLAAARADGVGLAPDDCYRPRDHQATAHAGACSGGNCACAAPAGTSMHGWGKAVDFDDHRGTLRFSSAGYHWMKGNAHRFGWNHPRWAEPGGSECPEAWHWEWVGDGGRMQLDPVRADVVGILGAGGKGYRVLTGLGGVAARGDAADRGSMVSTPIARLITGGTAGPAGSGVGNGDDDGYWLVAADGGVFAFGDAGFHGSMGHQRLHRPITGMAATPSGKGYWLVAADGGVFAFGDAGFFGSLGAVRLNEPIVAVAATGTGRGYWLVAADGGIFAFGDAPFHGSLGGSPPAGLVTAIAADPSGEGYWLAGDDGQVFPFGDARSFGDLASAPPAAPVVGMAATPGGRGYWLTGADGGVFAFGDARFHGTG